MNIVDPVEMLKKTTKSLLVPTSTTAATATHHHPLPTVIPDLPEFQRAHHDGKITLW